jgi:4-aminobutyrate aminotransferase
VLGKAIANGLPLSAVAARDDILSKWAPGSHGTTFGGNPVACAAAAATVDVLAGLLPGVPALSEQAFKRFREMKTKHPTIGDVRGLGLMIGIELVKPSGNEPDPDAYTFVATHARDHRLLILDCGPYANVIRFIPPLSVSMAELDQGIDILEAAIAAYEKR